MMACERRTPEGGEEFGHVGVAQLSGTTKPAQRGQHLCVEVCGNMNYGVLQPKPNLCSGVLAGQQIDHRRRIEHNIFE
jgi:hypothetical protein